MTEPRCLAAIASADVVVFCGIGSWRPASGPGCLGQREEGHGGGSPRRSVLMFPTLSWPPEHGFPARSGDRMKLACER